MLFQIMASLILVSVALWIFFTGIFWAKRKIKERIEKNKIKPRRKK